MADKQLLSDEIAVTEGKANLKEVAPRQGSFPIDFLVEEVKSGADVVGVQAPEGGLQAAILAELSARVGRPVMIVTERGGQAERLARDLQLFVDEEAPPNQDSSFREKAVFYPTYDVGPFYQASADRKVMMQRLAVLHELTEERPPRFAVGSVGAVMRRSLNRDSFQKHRRRFGIEDLLENEELRKVMRHCGYTEVSVVEDAGTFAVRGDIVDIFSPHEVYPFRLERWGDEIAEIRLFHPETQRSLETRSECVVFPVREAILDEDSVRRAIGRLRELNTEMERPFGALREVIADLQAGLHIVGIEALLPALHGEMEGVLAYTPDDTLVVVVEPESMMRRVEAVWEKRVREREEALGEGEYVFDVGEYYQEPGALKEVLIERRDLEWRRLQLLDEDSSEWPTASDSLVFRARENTDVVQLRRHYQGAEQTVRALTETMQDWKELYGRIAVVCRTQAQSERLVELMQSFGQNAVELSAPLDLSQIVAPPSDLIEVYRGDLSSGFRSELRGVALVSGLEIFGQRVVTGDRKSITEHAAITHFKDLSAGDLVVHVDFGIGRYQGIEHLHVEGVGNDFLYLEYAKGDKLYLPVYRLGRVQKYIGAADGVALDKMGGTRWERTKEQVKENIREIAGDLLALYARREMARGIAYSPPDEFYRQFEEAFPFEETPDQARAIEDVLHDMTRVRPMDRLICGDVGFGKTEVAIRAAMKAVVDGRQVAVLVPTTLLSEQHLISFRERMDEFGVRVEAVSRFRSAKESKEILEDTAEGKVDVLIGTHRLLSKDVEFRRLGLLIVDEDQRFGVKHKEKIKRLKSDIDVLTLTATPIPRTLQMSLLGIRDLTIIATPPHNRLAVRTHVAKFRDSIIREAIMRELSRGGQVFFVHNRVSTIKEIDEHLRKIVPEARIGIGHGQMGEGQLEKVMYAYIRGDINVLLCSSIVESGLDIPNANTIVINRADNFGLSQLYQLRGRVGRGKTRAYAYLLVPGRRKLPDHAQKRLEVIQTYTELGSGFHVASYDLEIRGAGNLLSDDQSGHVAAVGLDLYTDLLEETVNDLRGEEPDEAIEPEVNIAVEAFIPEDYIPATSLRLMFYKRYSLARSPEELGVIFEEMVDRFGEAPSAVRNLRRLIGIKVDLRRLKAHRLDAGMSAISIELDPRTTLDPARVVEMVKDSGGKWRLTSEMKLIYQLKVDESSRPLKTSREILDQLLSL